MSRRIPPSVRQAEATLSLLDKRAVILAWQSYQLEMHGVPPEVFGDAFDEYLDTALSTGDRLGVLTHGVHDVIIIRAGLISGCWLFFAVSLCRFVNRLTFSYQSFG